MLYDSHQRGQIVDRCWLIYELISQNFVTTDTFHIQYPDLVEAALLSGYIRLAVSFGERGYSIHLHEEYGFLDYKLVLKTYVYILFDKAKNAMLRADSLPHHKFDYKGHRVSHFPNCLHDEMGRICSFNGRIEDFIKRCSTVLD